MSCGRLSAGGILSLFVGFGDSVSPLFFSVVIAQFVGAIALFVALFGKEVTHRALEALFALIRIAAGFALFVCVASSIAVITMIFAVFLIVADFPHRTLPGSWTFSSGSICFLAGRLSSRSAWLLRGARPFDANNRGVPTTFSEKATSSFALCSLKQI
jgi:hypothetical protein